MGTILLNLLLLNLIAVIAIDRLHIDEPLKKLLWRWNMGALPYRDYTLKPFDCALCTGWWFGLLYMAIFIHPYTIWHIVLPLVFAYCNHIINDILTILRVWLNKLIEILL